MKCSRSPNEYICLIACHTKPVEKYSVLYTHTYTHACVYVCVSVCVCVITEMDILVKQILLAFRRIPTSTFYLMLSYDKTGQKV